MKSQLLIPWQYFILLIGSHIVLGRGPQFLEKCRSQLKIPGIQTLTQMMMHTVDPQILGTTIQIFGAQAMWHSAFVNF
jgi:hypothetical protein